MNKVKIATKKKQTQKNKSVGKQKTKEIDIDDI